MKLLNVKKKFQCPICGASSINQEYFSSDKHKETKKHKDALRSIKLPQIPNSFLSQISKTQSLLSNVFKKVLLDCRKIPFEEIFSNLIISLKPIFEILKRLYEYPIKSNKQNIELLRNYHSNENLALILGAGVSIEAGIPSWRGLLGHLLKKALISSKLIKDGKEEMYANLINQFLSFSNLIDARLIEEMMGKEEMINEIKIYLYDSLDEDWKNKSNILSNIVDLVSQRTNIQIISYNYDDLLEQIFDENEIAYEIKYSENNSWKKGNGVKIFHVHGFLPQFREYESNKIVFSEESYNKLFDNPHNWTNSDQIHLLSNSHTLIIGHSFLDPNIRRLCELIAKNKTQDQNMNHFIILKHPLAELLDFENNSKDKKEKWVFMENESYQDIYNFLNELAEIFKQMFSKFGINILWIYKFSDISRTLLKIME
ncbi:MAG: SIR2 family protein [Candidatus Lokiarchaeota archaeon]|nr:SIR2 family protein [Candidatus Harpocratesius repetitus]